MADFTGRKFGKYELVERLGRGGMADVYKAYQPGLDRYVAVKVMLGHLADSENFVTRFQREARIVGRLRHPNIVQVIDFDIEGDVYYMVMEYIRGDTLKSYIQKRGAIPVHKAFHIGEQLADALAYAHQEGMIHRDIKPANVMFTDQSYSHPVLTDFGIARILGDSGMTASGAFIGTPAYMAPEIGRGESSDERVDIYSTGVMLYEMLVGKVPYDADTPFAVVMKHISAPIPSPRLINSQLPEIAERIILKSLTKNPDDRYQTAGEMRDALKTAIQELGEQSEFETDTFISDAHEDQTLVDTPGDEHTLVDTANEERTVVDSAAHPEDATATVHTAEKVISDAPTDAGVQTEKTPLKLEEADAKSRSKRNRWIAAGVVVAILFVVILLLSRGENTEDAESGEQADTITEIAPGETAEPGFVATEEPSGEPTEIPPNETAEPSPEALAQNPDLSTIIDEGWDALAAGDTDAALDAFSRAVELNPDEAEAYEGLAETYRQMDDTDAALENLLQAIELAPEEIDALLSLAWLYQDVGNYDEAIETFSRVLELDPDSTEALLGRATTYNNAGNTPAALADIVRAIELTPEDSELHYSRGWILFEENPEEALPAFTTAAELDPENGFYWLAMGEASMALDDPETAIDHYQTALGLLDEPAIYARLGEAYESLDNTEAAIENYRQYLMRADEVNPDIEERLTALTGGEDPIIIQNDYYQPYTDNDDPDVLLLANQILETNNDGFREEALQMASDALETYPDNPILLHVRADLNIGLGNLETGLADAERAVELHSEHPAGYLSLVRYYFFTGEYDGDKGFAAAQTAYDLNNENPEVLLMYARANWQVDNPDEAINAYYQAEEQGMPANYVAPERINALWNLNRYADIIPDARHYLANTGEDQDIRLLLAGSYLKVDEPESALQTVRETDISIENTSYSANAAYVLYATGNYEQARELVRTVVNISRADVESTGHYIQGLLAFENERYVVALQQFAIVEDRPEWEYQFPFLNPKFGHSLEVDRARVYRASGELDKAIEAYTRAIDENSWWSLPYIERAETYLIQDPDAIQIARQDLLDALRNAIEADDYETQDQIIERIRELNDIAAAEFTERYVAYTDEDDPAVIEIANRAHLYFRFQGTYQALERLEEGLAIHPDNPILLSMRALYAIEDYRLEDALAAAEAAIVADDRHPAGYLALARYHLARESDTSARQAQIAVETALELAPDHPETSLVYGIVLRYLESYDEALARFNTAEELGMPLFDVITERIQLYRETGNLEGILEDAAVYVRLGEDLYRLDMVQVYVQQGEIEPAVEIMRGATLPYTSNAYFYGNMAYVMYRGGYLEEAEAIAAETIETGTAVDDQYTPTALYVQALLDTENENYEAALTKFQELELIPAWRYDGGFLNPAYGHSLYLDMGRTYQSSGDLEAALEVYSNALDNNPELFEGYLARGTVYRELGNLEAARENFRIALDKAPSESLREDIINILNELGEE